jgi:hypothetical protein
MTIRLGGRGGQTPGADGEDGQGVGGGKGGKGGKGIGPMATAGEPHGGVRQVVIGPAHWTAFETWINAHGHVLAMMPAEHQNPDDLPTWVILPKAP